MSLQEQLEKVQNDLQKIEERRKELKQGLQQKRMRKSERL